MDNAEIKPCPFCPNGGKPEYGQPDPINVMCRECGVFLGTKEAWNNRPELDAKTARIKELVEAALAVEIQHDTVTSFTPSHSGIGSCPIDRHDDEGCRACRLKKLAKEALEKIRPSKCKHKSTWFDRTISLSSDGKEDRMHTRCSDCGIALD